MYNDKLIKLVLTRTEVVKILKQYFNDWVSYHYNIKKHSRSSYQTFIQCSSMWDIFIGNLAMHNIYKWTSRWRHRDKIHRWYGIVLRTKYPTKRMFRIFHILNMKNDVFYLFTEQPSSA